MKKGWETKKLAGVCEVIAGQSPEGKFYNAEGKGTPFYQGKKDFGDKFIEVPTTWTTQTTKTAKLGDILMSVRAPVGPVNFATEEICIGRGLAAIRSGTQLNRDFLFYQLLHLQPMIAGKEGAVFASISKSEIEELSLAFAPLSEQQRIAAILDEAFEGLATAKANAEKNLQNAREIFESHLNEVFAKKGDGWVETTLGEVSQFKNGLNYNKSSGGQTLPVVGVADFRDNYFVPFSELQSATIDGDLAGNYAIQPGDILTVRSNGSKHLVGRCMLVGDVDEVVSYSGFIIRIRFDAKTIFPKFLLHFMKCQITRDILTAGGGGANINNINQEKLSSLLVPIPPFKNQVKIADELDSLYEETQRLARIYSRKLAALEELKKALLHRAFRGELG